MPVPYYDLVGRLPRREQSAHHGGNDCGPGAANGAGRRKNLDAHDVFLAHQTAPGVAHSGLERKKCQAAIEGLFHPCVIRHEGIEQMVALHDGDVGDGIGGVKRKKLLRPGGNEPAEQQKNQTLAACVS